MEAETVPSASTGIEWSLALPGDLWVLWELRANDFRFQKTEAVCTELAVDERVIYFMGAVESRLIARLRHANSTRIGRRR